MTDEPKPQRRFEDNRYQAKALMFLDLAQGGFSNSYEVLDRGKRTGITYVDGRLNRNVPATRTVMLNGVVMKNLREAIFAYEDQGGGTA